MQEQSGKQAEFDALCSQYGLPVGDSNYFFLLDLFQRRRQGVSFTDEEILSDFTALDIARMLKQLSFSKGYFSLKVVGDREKDYTNPALVGIIKQSLEDALGKRVEKGDNNMLLSKSKGYGAGGDQSRGLLIPYPEGYTPQEVGFSDVELQCIIDFEEGLAVEVKKMQGNKERWEEKGKSRLPELGKLAEWIIINYLPKEWKEVDKHNFVADYLFNAGFLDFKSEIWKAGFRDKKKEQKYKMVLDWIKAYHTTQNRI